MTHPKPAEDKLDVSDERWKLVGVIVLSSSFAKAPRLSGFLTYICSRTLRGQAAELNEREIGIEVFGRSASYNPADDSIVRATARLLRARLDQYFSSEGIDSAWVITIPKGSYVPVFEKRPQGEQALPAAEPAPSPPIAEPVALPVATRSRAWLYAAAVLLAGIAAIVLYRRTSAEETPPPDAGQKLWSTLLGSSRTTLLVPADSTLALLEAKRKTAITLSEYVNRTYAPTPDEESNLGEHQFTSIADLTMAFRMARLPQAQHARLEVRYARDLNLGDVKSSNLVLLGGVRANPWVELFRDRMDYFVDNDPDSGQDYVLVRNPRDGERARYNTDKRGAETYSFGVAAFVAGFGGEGNALLLGGTSMAGTESVCDFLLDPAVAAGFERKVTRPDGKLNHFEVLVQTSIVHGNASESKVLAYRILP